jgi:hypothetical protein
MSTYYINVNDGGTLNLHQNDYQEPSSQPFSSPQIESRPNPILQGLGAGLKSLGRSYVEAVEKHNIQRDIEVAQRNRINKLNQERQLNQERNLNRSSSGNIIDANFTVKQL